nr:MAG TPA: hypothetical protein [Caudoviricetes sp.]
MKAQKRKIKQGITRTTCRHHQKRPLNTNNYPTSKTIS